MQCRVLRLCHSQGLLVLTARIQRQSRSNMAAIPHSSADDAEEAIVGAPHASHARGFVPNGAEDVTGGSPHAKHACSFVPEEYQQLLTPTELAIVVGVVQRVLDGQLAKAAIAQVCGAPKCDVTLFSARFTARVFTLK